MKSQFALRGAKLIVALYALAFLSGCGAFTVRPPGTTALSNQFSGVWRSIDNTADNQMFLQVLGSTPAESKIYFSSWGKRTSFMGNSERTSYDLSELEASSVLIENETVVALKVSRWRGYYRKEVKFKDKYSFMVVKIEDDELRIYPVLSGIEYGDQASKATTPYVVQRLLAEKILESRKSSSWQELFVQKTATAGVFRRMNSSELPSPPVSLIMAEDAIDERALVAAPEAKIISPVSGPLAVELRVSDSPSDVITDPIATAAVTSALRMKIEADSRLRLTTNKNEFRVRIALMAHTEGGCSVYVAHMEVAPPGKDAGLNVGTFGGWAKADDFLRQVAYNALLINKLFNRLFVDDNIYEKVKLLRDRTTSGSLEDMYQNYLLMRKSQ